MLQHADPNFVQVFDEALENRQQVLLGEFLPQDKSELVYAKGQRPPYFPLQSLKKIKKCNHANKGMSFKNNLNDWRTSLLAHRSTLMPTNEAGETLLR